MFKNNKLKIFIVFFVGAIIGSASTFYFSAKLAGEVEAHARLAGLMKEISTIAIFVNRNDLDASHCFLKEEAELNIAAINEIITWLTEKRIKISGLNNFYTYSARVTIAKYNEKAAIKLNAQCN